MTTVNKVYTPSLIIQAPVDVWMDVAAPPSAVPPVQGTNTLTLDANGEPPDSSTTGLISALSLGNAGGTGYAVGDIFGITQSGGINGLGVVLTESGGVVQTMAVLRAGMGYAAANNLPTTVLTGGGNGALTVDVTAIQAGTHLGLIDGPSSVSNSPKFEAIMSDQWASPVDAAFVSLATEFDVIVKETLLKNIQRFFAGFGTGTFFQLPAGNTNPAADFLQLGSGTSSQSQVHTLMLIWPRRDVPGKWFYAMGYRVYLASAIALAVQRKKETVMKLKFKSLADTARVGSDQVMQFVRMT